MIAATDASATATPYAYPATGEPKGGWSSSAPAFRYTGQVAIASAQIYYYKARMYDPALGRFLQTDPVGYQARGTNGKPNGNKQPTSQQACVNDFNDTALGQATNFFNLLSPVLGPDPWWQSTAEIGGSYTLKAGTYYAGEVAGRAALNPTIGPNTARILSGLNGVTQAGLSVAKRFGVPLVAGATIFQAQVHLACYLFSPQASQ